jgi:REP element-mobilizing transposase RayT
MRPPLRDLSVRLESRDGNQSELFVRIRNPFCFSHWQNSGMQFYRRNLPHLQRDFKPHLITFVTKFRWTLPDWARDIALSSCCDDHRKLYELYVAVVMPDHVHMILTPLIDQRRDQIFSLIEIMRNIKGAAGRKINQRMGRHGAVWQEESFDHVLRSSEGLDAKVDYVLQNPVRKGLVDDWRQYRWIWQRAEREEAEMTIRR